MNNSIPVEKANMPPRARCIIEFIEGDTSRAPVIYPLGGSDQIDGAMCDAILARWESDEQRR
jgi:hypothetical protein